MFKYTIIISILFLSLASCDEQIQPPIDQEKMVKILADIHLSESASKSLPNRQKDTVLAKYYEQIMEIHEVSKADFDSTIVILKKNPSEMLKVYEKVMEHIDTEKTAHSE